METAGPNHVGGRVKVTGRGVGTLLFYGKTQFQNGDWCGVWLDEARGKNDGSVNGTRYFKCPSNHGVFVSPANVVPVFEAKKAPRRQGSVRTPKASSQRQASTPTSRTGSAVRKDATAAAKEGTKEGAGKDLAASGTKEGRTPSRSGGSPKATRPGGKSKIASPKGSRKANAGAGRGRTPSSRPTGRSATPAAEAAKAKPSGKPSTPLGRLKDTPTAAAQPPREATVSRREGDKGRLEVPPNPARAALGSSSLASLSAALQQVKGTDDLGCESFPSTPAVSEPASRSESPVSALSRASVEPPHEEEPSGSGAGPVAGSATVRQADTTATLVAAAACLASSGEATDKTAADGKSPPGRPKRVGSPKNLPRVPSGAADLATIATLKASNDELRSSRDALDKQLAEAVSARAAQAAEAAAMRASIEQLEGDRAVLLAELDSTKAAAQADSEAAAVAVPAEALATIRELQAANAQLVATQAKLENQIQRRESAAAQEAQTAHMDLISRHAALEAQLEAANAQIQAEEDAKWNVHDLKAKHDMMKEQLEANKTAMTTTIKKLRGEHSRALDRLQARLAKAEAMNTSLAMRTQQSEAEKAAVVSESQHEFEQARKDHAEEVGSLKNEVRGLQERLTASAAERKSELARLSQAHASALDEARLLLDKKLEAERQLVLEQQAAGDKSAAALMSDMQESHQRELAAANAAAEAHAVNAIAAAEQNAAAALASLAGLQGELHEARAARDDEAGARARAEAALREARAAHEAAVANAASDQASSANVADLTAQLQAAQAALGSSSVEVAQLRSQAEASADAAAMWEDKARTVDANASTAVRALQAQLDELQRKSGAGEERLASVSAQYSDVLRRLEVKTAEAHRWEGEAIKLQQYAHSVSGGQHATDSGGASVQEVEALLNDLEEAGKARSQWEDRYRAAQAELESRAEHGRKGEQELGVLRRQLQELQSENDRLRLHSSQAGSVDVEAIVQQVRKENERDLENVRRQLRESREEAKMFKVKAERMEAESNSDPDALPAQNRKLAEELDRARFELESMNGILSKKNGENKEMRAKLQRLEHMSNPPTPERRLGESPPAQYNSNDRLNQTLPLPQRGSPQQAQPLERPQGRFMRSSSLRRDNRPKSTFG